MSLLHIGGGSGSSVVAPEGVDFDGVSDYLSRSTDLVGNVDGKTLTFSCWVYIAKKSGDFNILESGNNKFTVGYSETNSRISLGINGGNTLAAQTVNNTLPKETWLHIIWSVDMSDTNKRHLYVNDFSNAQWNTYNNLVIDFTQVQYLVGRNYNNTTFLKGRLSNVFLDYTYRDLSIEANRRLFITADGKPASGLENVMNEVAPFDTLIDSNVGTYFNGATDYLYKAGEFSGLPDANNITIAFWVYVSEIQSAKRLLSFKNSSSTESYIALNGSSISGYNSLYTNFYRYTTNVLYGGASDPLIPNNTWTHITMQLDHDGVGNSIKVYVNGVLKTYSYASEALNSDAILLTATNWAIASATTGGSLGKFRIRDLIITDSIMSWSNFINTDKTPKTQAELIALNKQVYFPLSSDYINYGTSGGSFTVNGAPIQGQTESYHTPLLYLPMTDASTAHVNLGTGGNFVQNGTLATADRGANQDNCVASLFNGTSQYLSRTSLTGISNIGKATINFTIKATTTSYENIYFAQSGSYKLTINIGGNSGRVTIVARNSSNSVILNAYSNTQVCTTNKIYNISISFDLSITNSTKLVVNGINTSITNGTFINDIIPFSTINQYYISRDSSGYSNIELGELYFDTKYIDLATNNPFWDAVENKPVPVRKVIANTGVTPLIAMPLDASNAGKNYGTGGDFTANSAPYVGARGASEFWARSAKFDGSTGYLRRGALDGAVDSKTFSFVMAIKSTTSDYGYLLSQGVNKGVSCNYSGTYFQIFANKNDGTLLLNKYTQDFNVSTTDAIVMVCVDLANISNFKIYINGSLATVQGTTYINDVIGFSSALTEIGREYLSGNNFNGNISMCYFTTDYIDFSQEANRLKFVDGLGYPLDLKKQIDAGVIPKPLVYLPFDDPSNLGKNLGTGGTFSVVGSVTQGSDVNG